MTRSVDACPDCDSTRICANSGGGIEVDGEPHWYCRECQLRFDSPKKRDAHGHGSAGGSALVAKLDAADPEEVSR